MGRTLVIAPTLALVGPGGEPALSQAQADALNEAFDLVDHFRIVVRRVATNETVVDTLIAVTPGQDEYDLSVSVDALGGSEQFSVALTALQGTRELFTADPVTVRAAPASATSSSPPAATNVTMRYSGPGATATSLQITPAALVLAPGGNGSYTAQVQASDGSVIEDVPLSWATVPAGVVTVGGGQATAVAEGAVEVVVGTPAGLTARAWAYVVGGELAYAEGGVVRVRGAGGGSVTDRTAPDGAGQPAWSADGGLLYYAAGGRVLQDGGGDLTDGNWPSVSPDGTKLAVERGGRVYFTNEDGSGATEGPAGQTPVWVDGSNILVSGGSVERVRADDTGRTTVVGGAATLPALGPGGEVAYVSEGGLYVVGRTEAVLDGAVGRPTWSGDGQWLVVRTGGGLSVVPADGRGPGAELPGLSGASDPAFKPAGMLEPPLTVQVTGLDPDPPTPGQPVTLQGIGFDWIIPGNNVVYWPTPAGPEPGGTAVRVTETTLETVMPNSVVEGQIRVETRSSTDVFAFSPEIAAIDVLVRTPFEAPVSGVEVAVRDEGGTEVLRQATDDSGRTLLTGLMPGTYEVEVLLPTGFRLDGDAVHVFTLGTETVPLVVVVVPMVETVTTEPEELSVEVGQNLDVTLIPVDFRGEVMEQLVTSTWVGGLPSVVTRGQGLSGTIWGGTPSTGPMQSVLAVELNGDVFEIPVSVTSYVEGTVVRDPDPSPSPANSAIRVGGGSSASSASSASSTSGATKEVAAAAVTATSDSTTGPAAVTTEPSLGTEVHVVQSGVVMSTATSDGLGKYHAGGLFAGTYAVSIDPTADRSPVPGMQTVVLDDDHPFAIADFLMSRAPVYSLVLTAAPMEIDAIDGTTTVLIDALDIDGNHLGGRPGTFLSSNPAVATVSSDGLVTAVGNGSTTITVTVEAITNTITISVDQKAVAITLLDDGEGKPLPDKDRTFVGETGTLLWKALDANGYAITHKSPTFASTDPSVVSIDASGVVAALSVGQADLTATMDAATDLITVVILDVHVGDLFITGPSDLLAVQTSLIGMVTGNLVIESTSLANLDGLESLIEIRGSVVLRLNSLLGNLEGLGGIDHVLGDLIIEGNPLLVTPPLGTPTQLRAVEGSLRVIDNDAIVHMDGFGMLEFVGVDIEFVGNGALANLDGLTSLRHLDGLLSLKDNPVLDSRGNLPNVLSIAGNLVVEAGARVFGLPRLTAVQGALQVGGTISVGNTVVQEIDMPMLICTGQGVFIYENTSLTTVRLPALDLVEASCGTPSITPTGPRPSVLPDLLFRPDAPNAPGIPAVSYGDVDRQARGRGRASEQRLAEARAARDEVRRSQLSEARRRTKEARSASTGSTEDAGPGRRGSDGRTNSSQPALDAGPLPVGGSGLSIEIWTNPALATLDLSRLVETDDALGIWNNGLTALSLPMLEIVGGRLYLSQMPNLLSVSAPLLMSVGGVLDVSYDPVLSSFQAPALETASGVSLVSNGALGAFSLPQLQQLPSGDFYAWGNTGLTSVSLPVLAFVMDGTGFYNNSGLLNIEMATLSTLDMSEDPGDLAIYDNPDLQTVNVPGLTETFDGIRIQRNNALVSVSISTSASLDSSVSIRDNNVPHPWSVTIPGLINGFNVTIRDNTGLQSVTMASTAAASAGQILFQNNAGLQSISFPQLTSVSWRSLTVLQSPDLLSISAPVLSSTGWDLKLEGMGTAGTATTLAFDALVAVGRYLLIENSPGLRSFSLPALGSVRSGGTVQNNTDLTSFSLPALTHMTTPPGPAPERYGPSPAAPPASSAANLTIESNPLLTSFDIHALTEVRDLFVNNNAALAVLPAVGPLSAGTRVLVHNNPALTSMAGLAAVTDLYTLSLDNNPVLEGATHLGSLQALVDLNIRNDGATGTLSLPALTRVWGTFRAESNTGLTGIAAPALTLLGPGSGPSGFGGELFVLDNPVLMIADFPAMATVEGLIEYDNNGLVNLDGLSALRSPVYGVIVQNNAALTSILGLAGIGTTSATPAVMSSFYIGGNTVLSDCHVNDDVVSVIEARNPGGAFGITPLISNVTCGP